MEKNVRYSIVALAVLGVAALGVGAFYWGEASISASTAVPSNSSSVESEAIPLKQGWNKITNGPKSIYLDSEIIGVNGWLQTVAQAQKEGRIGEIKTVEGDKVLGRDIEKIDPNAVIYINASKTDGPLAVYLQKI